MSDDVIKCRMVNDKLSDGARMYIMKTGHEDWLIYYLLVLKKKLILIYNYIAYLNVFYTCNDFRFRGFWKILG